MRRLVLPLLAAPLLVTALPATASAAAPTSPGPDVVVAGSGWGHSVGMSQYGARAMAQAGRSAEQILLHYYPGVSVRSDVGPGDEATVAVDLFRNRTITQEPERLLVLGKARDGGPAPLRLVTSLGPVDVDPGRSPYSIAFEAGAYVVRTADGQELVRTAEPVRTEVAHPAMVALPQLGASLDGNNRSGTFAWGSVHTEVVDGRVVPVLRQSMRDYLKGIAEMPSSWEAAALQAQAIAARTYAARFDGQTISATPANQAYSGWAKEGEPGFGPRWVAAVEATAGRKVVAPDGRLAQTFYSSSHGLGRSEASAASWAYGSAFSYLRSVDDPWSQAESSGNPYRSWTARADNAGFAGVLGLARVNSVRVLSRSEGGSPLELDVDGWRSDGVRTTVRWKGAYSAGDARGAGSRLRLALPLKEGGAGGRLRSQQISAITIAPFTDDEDSVHQYNIGAVAATGVAQGCSTTTFCPRGAVTRGQMAAFLARALQLPPYVGPDLFTDIAASPQRDDINRLAAAQRVGGFPDGTYRPFGPVTREQMATFLGRAFDVPTATGPDRFTDIAASVHRQRINDVAARGLTGGCTATTYCPSGTVTREQMASFLARATGVGG